MQEDKLKTPISPALIIGVAVAAVLVLAFIGYRVFATPESRPPSADQAAAMNKSSAGQGEAYSQQIKSMPKAGSSGRGNYGSSYGQQYGQSGMGRR